MDGMYMNHKIDEPGTPSTPQYIEPINFKALKTKKALLEWAKLLGVKSTGDKEQIAARLEKYVDLYNERANIQYHQKIDNKATKPMKSVIDRYSKLSFLELKGIAKYYDLAPARSKVGLIKQLSELPYIGPQESAKLALPKKLTPKEKELKDWEDRLVAWEKRLKDWEDRLKKASSQPSPQPSPPSKPLTPPSKKSPSPTQKPASPPSKPLTPPSKPLTPPSKKPPSPTPKPSSPPSKKSPSPPSKKPPSPYKPPEIKDPLIRRIVDTWKEPEMMDIYQKAFPKKYVEMEKTITKYSDKEKPVPLHVMADLFGRDFIHFLELHLWPASILQGLVNTIYYLGGGPDQDEEDRGPSAIKSYFTKKYIEENKEDFM